MTWANRITVLRILIIPIFVIVVLDYVRDFQRHDHWEMQSVLAFGLFALAAISDAVDGFIARRFNQRTEVGAYLDPIADKGLLVTALLLLSFDNGGAFRQLPLWFLVLVISRDLILLIGTILIHMIVGKVLPRPRWPGKCATAFQMVTIGWILLKIQYPPMDWPMYAAGLFTLVSGVWYIFDGVKTLSGGERRG